jgi:hypothetical protein
MLATVVERNTSHAIKITCNLDFTGWDFIYLVKTNPNEPDADAVIPDLVPTLIEETITAPDGTETVVKKILISFLPAHTANLSTRTYYHGLRAVSDNKLSVIPIFNGTLTITDNFIEGPFLS